MQRLPAWSLNALSLVVCIAVGPDLLACSPVPGGGDPYADNWSLSSKLAAATCVAAACTLWLRSSGATGALTLAPIVLFVLHPAWTMQLGSDCGATAVMVGVPVTAFAVIAAGIGAGRHIRKGRRRTSG